MVDIVKKHHKSYKNFFTPEECELIISVFERDKDTIPYGTEEETGYKGLTSAYSVYNWLYNKDIIPLNIPQRLFNLPEFNKWQYMITQCWGNALHVGEDLKNHYHGAELPHEFMRRYMFYNANIFLGGEYNLTWYEDTDYVENQIGDIHIFTCDLEHRVDKNVGEDTRYSMAIDIYPSAERITDYNQERYHMSKNERTEYRDTIPMRFYIARALFAIDYHNKIIMEESRNNTKQSKKAIAFHTKQRDRLIEWNNEYKDWVQELEKTNSDYGVTLDIPPLNFENDRDLNKERIFKFDYEDTYDRGYPQGYKEQKTRDQ